MSYIILQITVGSLFAAEMIYVIVGVEDVEDVGQFVGFDSVMARLVNLRMHSEQVPGNNKNMQISRPLKNTNARVVKGVTGITLAGRSLSSVRIYKRVCRIGLAIRVTVSPPGPRI